MLHTSDSRDPNRACKSASPKRWHKNKSHPQDTQLQNKTNWKKGIPTFQMWTSQIVRQKDTPQTVRFTMAILLTFRVLVVLGGLGSLVDLRGPRVHVSFAFLRHALATKPFPQECLHRACRAPCMCKDTITVTDNEMSLYFSLPWPWKTMLECDFMWKCFPQVEREINTLT